MTGPDERGLLSDAARRRAGGNAIDPRVAGDEYSGAAQNSAAMAGDFEIASAGLCTAFHRAPSRGGRGDAGRTLDICAQLLDDREPMVIKALSWALRALAKRDPYAVKKFSSRHQDRLPAREVRNVLDSGVKRPSR
jgi:hypothetical protein